MPSSVAEGKRWIGEALEKLHQDQPPKLFLDVGCGDGTYSKLFRRKFPSKWWGIEVFAPYLKRYRLLGKYDRVFQQNVLDFIQELPDHQGFSVVILGDVLEHLIEKDAIRVYNFFCCAL